MKFLAFLLSISLFVVSALSAEVLVRIDEKGNTVFYNTPKKVSAAHSANVKTFPLTYSKKLHDYAPLIEKVCDKYLVDSDLVKAVIQVESAYNPQARSRAGALGLMQLMPGTAERFGVKQIYDPSENIHGGVQYIKFLLDLFKNDLTLAVAAYNAGEGAVRKFNGVPRYAETQDYVKKVLTLYGKEYDSPVVIVPKKIYKFVDPKGKVIFTTEKRPGSVEISRPSSP